MIYFSSADLKVRPGGRSGRRVYLFPVAAIIDYHKVSSLKHRFILFQLWRSELKTQFHRANSEDVGRAGSFQRL